MRLRSYENAKVLFDTFAGECFDNDGHLVIIVQIDDGGCVCEDVDGEEKFYKFYELSVDDKVFQKILAVKNRESVSWGNN